MTDTLTWLQQWYRSRCDGHWEHDKGIRIETLDNPGWIVEADVGEGVSGSLDVERSDTDWVRCEVRQGRFHGFGGVENLGELLQILRGWTEAACASPERDP